MKIKTDRRTFLVLLGMATAAMGIRHRRHVCGGAPGSRPAVPKYLFVDAPAHPPFRPRTSAITYLPGG